MSAPTLRGFTAAEIAALPRYRFGSPEHAAMHKAHQGPPVRTGTAGAGWKMIGGAWVPARTYPRLMVTYERDGRPYVVDHGRFRTLGMIQAGQVVPHVVDLPVEFDPLQGRDNT